MRENITGIRVVKALSKEEYEICRFGRSNEQMAKNDIKASIVMALPGPVTTLVLNIGLTAVVIVGAVRVNSGVTKPGVILAFLTYFNMILMGVMALNRVFMLMSKANASADRIAEGIHLEDELVWLTALERAVTERKEYIIFDNVHFSYGGSGEEIRNAARDARAQEFIEAYEDAYDHRALSHGMNLSGGQRQRVLIARALAAFPRILILDDSSSALDYRTDAALHKAIREHHGDTTTIVVAQRIGSIMSLDKIIVLDEGKIIGYGSQSVNGYRSDTDQLCDRGGGIWDDGLYFADPCAFRSSHDSHGGDLYRKNAYHYPAEIRKTFQKLRYHERICGRDVCRTEDDHSLCL